MSLSNGSGALELEALVQALVRSVAELTISVEGVRAEVTRCIQQLQVTQKAVERCELESLKAQQAATTASNQILEFRVALDTMGTEIEVLAATARDSLTELQKGERRIAHIEALYAEEVKASHEHE